MELHKAEQIYKEIVIKICITVTGAGQSGADNWAWGRQSCAEGQLSEEGQFGAEGQSGA